jgi:hypothetical protein
LEVKGSGNIVIISYEVCGGEERDEGRAAAGLARQHLQYPWPRA